ncbi:high affinity copper uptake protein 1-like isoform X2 [Choristoneura fumiferana]|uniref:high affinity copper uptake protein 1-like isoform X2 n=1 Tax=Choristoneura fumiferana TaxID=7141 RepID=UPI003D15CDB6
MEHMHAGHEMGGSDHHNMMDHASHSGHMMHEQNFEDPNSLLNASDDNMSYKIARQGEHSGHGDHSIHSVHNPQHSMMSMTFHGGYVETILFSWWNVTDIGEFIGSFLAIFLMALLYEGLKYYRKHLLWKTYAGLQYCAVSPPDKGVSNLCSPDEPQVIQPRMLSGAHAWQTALHGLQVLVSYMLMLVFMTYNTWLCAAVVLGSASGYFLFGWRESVVVDFTEHCH